MKDLFDYWIDIGKWNSQQAALICNSKDPRHCKRPIKFPPGDSNDYTGFKLNTWQQEVLENYYVFENADWRKYIDEMSDFYFYFRHPKEAWYGHFLDITVNKKLKLPTALSDEWVKLKLSVNKNEEIEITGALVEKEGTEARNKRIFK